jgi:DNA/RNA-binding domain of Phe-tRNA-synthetase-like protein
MKFIVQSGFDTAFPGMKLAVGFARDVDNTLAGDTILHELRAAETELRSHWKFQNAQSHPSIKCWRVAMKRNGVSSDYPSAIESLVGQVLRGRPLANINPIVSLGNLAAITHLAPVGLFSADDDIYLRWTQAGENFTELGRTVPVAVDAGEICYATSSALVTRHFVWRQSEMAKVTEPTRRVFFVSEVLPEAGSDTAERIVTSFAANLHKFFGVHMRTAILTSDACEWEFEPATATAKR